MTAHVISVPDLELVEGPVDGDAALGALFVGARELLKRGGHPTNVAARLTSEAGSYRLDVALDTEELGAKVAVVAEVGREVAAKVAVERLLLELESELGLRAEEDQAYGGPEELRAGADSPLTAPTGERLLDEVSYAGMRAAVLNVSQGLGGIDLGMFDALVATCERSVGPGLEQAVADGTIPVDKLSSARDALELELELFKAAAIFRRRIATVQDRVRAHVATEEANAGAPPAIEVIRHNAGRNGGGT